MNTRFVRALVVASLLALSQHALASPAQSVAPFWVSGFSHDAIAEQLPQITDTPLTRLKKAADLAHLVVSTGRAYRGNSVKLLPNTLVSPHISSQHVEHAQLGYVPARQISHDQFKLHLGVSPLTPVTFYERTRAPIARGDTLEVRYFNSQGQGRTLQAEVLPYGIKLSEPVLPILLADPHSLASQILTRLVAIANDDTDSWRGKTVAYLSTVLGAELFGHLMGAALFNQDGEFVGMIRSLKPAQCEAFTFNDQTVAGLPIACPIEASFHTRPNCSSCSAHPQPWRDHPARQATRTRPPPHSPCPCADKTPPHCRMLCPSRRPTSSGKIS